MLSSLRGSHPSIHQPAAASRSAFLTESDVDLCQKSFICRGARGHGKRRTGLTFGTREVRLFISAANRLIGEVVQSRRRPLLGPSPG